MRDNSHQISLSLTIVIEQVWGCKYVILNVGRVNWTGRSVCLFLRVAFVLMQVATSHQNN